MKCENCESYNIQLSPNGEYVCASCGVVQIYECLQCNTTHKNTYFPNITHNSDCFPGTYFKNPKATSSGLVKMAKSDYLRNEQILSAMYQALSNIINKYDLNFNEESKRSIIEINKTIRSIVKNRKNEQTLIVAIIFYYNQRNLLTVNQVFKLLKITHRSQYLRIIEKVKHKLTLKPIKPETIKTNLMLQLMENDELRQKISKNDIKNIFEIVDNKFNEEISSYAIENRQKVHVVARCIYNIISKYKKRFITQKMISNIANVPIATLRDAVQLKLKNNK